MATLGDGLGQDILPQATSQSREVSGVQFDLLLSSKNICNAIVNEFGHFSIKAVKEKHLYLKRFWPEKVFH